MHSEGNVWLYPHLCNAELITLLYFISRILCWVAFKDKYNISYLHDKQNYLNMLKNKLVK